LWAGIELRCFRSSIRQPGLLCGGAPRLGPLGKRHEPVVARRRPPTDVISSRALLTSGSLSVRIRGPFLTWANKSGARLADFRSICRSEEHTSELQSLAYLV